MNRLLLTAVAAGALGFSSAANAAPFSFSTVADANERAIADGSTEVFGGFAITFSATGNGVGSPSAWAYLDSFSGGKPGGLGVCSALIGGLDDKTGRGNECDPSSDDNLGLGETLTLAFTGVVNLTFSSFRDDNHNAVDTTKKLTINGTEYTFGDALSMTFTASSFTFGHVDQAYYLDGGAITSASEPAMIGLLGLGLLGLGFAARRRG